MQTPEPNLAVLVSRHAAQMPDFKVLTFVSVSADGSFKDETRTFAQLHERAGALAGRLADLGVGKGTKFAIMMANRPAFVEAMLAAAWLGAAFVPIDPRAVGDKLEYMLDFSECEGVICSADGADACMRTTQRIG